MPREPALPPFDVASSESTALEWLEALAGYVKAVTVYPETNTRVQEGLERALAAVAAARIDQECTPVANVSLVFDGAAARVGKVTLEPREGSNGAWLRERFERTSLAGIEVEPDAQPADLAAFTRELLGQYARTQLDREFDRLWEDDLPRIRLRRRLFDGVFSDIELPPLPEGTEQVGPAARVGAALADHLARDPQVCERMRVLEQRLETARKPGEQVARFDILARLAELMPADAYSDERRVCELAMAILDALLAVPSAQDDERSGDAVDEIDARLARLVRLSTQRFFGRAGPAAIELQEGDVDSDEVVARRRARDEEITDDLQAFLAEIRCLPPLEERDVERDLESAAEQLAVWLFHLSTREEPQLVERLRPGFRRLLATPDAELLEVLAGYLEQRPDADDIARRAQIERIARMLMSEGFASLVLRCGALSVEDVQGSFPENFVLLLHATDLSREDDVARLEELCLRLGHDALVGAAPTLLRDGLHERDLGRRLLALGRPGFAPLAAVFLECAGEALHAEVVGYLRALSPARAEACLLRIVGDPRQIPLAYLGGLLNLLGREPGRRDPGLDAIIGDELCRFVLARAGEPEAAERRAYAIRCMGEFPSSGSKELLEGILDDRRWLLVAREPKCVRAAARETLRRF